MITVGDIIEKCNSGIYIINGDGVRTICRLNPDFYGSIKDILSIEILSMAIDSISGNLDGSITINIKADLDYLEENDENIEN